MEYLSAFFDSLREEKYRKFRVLSNTCDRNAVKDAPSNFFSRLRTVSTAVIPSLPRFLLQSLSCPGHDWPRWLRFVKLRPEWQKCPCSSRGIEEAPSQAVHTCETSDVSIWWAIHLWTRSHQANKRNVALKCFPH